MNIIDLWKEHGTKFIGAAVTVFGAALAVNLFDPQYDKYLEFGVIVLGGSGIKRGFTNTRNTP